MLEAVLHESSLSSIGRTAYNSLCASEISRVTGRIVSKFHRSCLLELGTGVLCIGFPDIGRGPLNCLIHEDTESIRAFNRLAEGDKIHVRQDSLRVNGRVIGFGRATVWDRCLTADTGEFVYRHRSRLYARVRSVCALSPVPSLCDIVVDRFNSESPGVKKITTGKSLQDHVEMYFIEVLGELQIRLAEFYRAPPVRNETSLSAIFPAQTSHEQAHLSLALSTIMGAGAGLTPAGDDFLSGVVLASNLCGFHDHTSALMDLIMPLAATQTNLISARFLELAAEGRAAERIHDFLDHVTGNLQGRQQKAWDESDCVYCARLLGSVGHSSGWDIVAGVLFAFRIFANNVTPESDIRGSTVININDFA